MKKQQPNKIMDDEHVCPLCCEELDLSDREFYPCKCGYQVCMWCWHRIRELETGLCPACRTPYGEDPHQFTALDVEEVLKANREAKQAAAKKRERQQQHSQHSHSHQHNNSNSNHIRQRSNSSNDNTNTSGMDSGGGGGDHNAGGGGGGTAGAASAAMDVPKDRSSLANMRVIQRNLVYAVGLPPHIATEEILRKPEYFGQYGKIAKIVLNRSQQVTTTTPAEGNDPRHIRAPSASAYCTFQYPQDALACILVLDGFCLENRNIRASYGTSKYCSAFIKNMRCNNPECTYLHEMGAAEDTFTKQEIQAGYVTSGRDVLARQEQIVAEQLKQQQQQQNAGGGAAALHAVVPRKRTGGGGPTGTGRASTNPVFPPPEFDEPGKQSAPKVPPPVGVTRATTATATMTPAQQAALLNPATISAKLGRSASTGTSSRGGAPAAAPQHQRRKPTVAATAASVVAGGRPPSSKDGSDSYPLTALTPLKRTMAKPGPTATKPVEEKPAASLRNGKKKTAGTKTSKNTSNSSGIGGDVIGVPPEAQEEVGGRSRSKSPAESAVGALGGTPIPVSTSVPPEPNPNRSSAANLLGGEVFTGSLSGQKMGSASVIGSSLNAGSDTAVLQGGQPSLWTGGNTTAPGSVTSGSGVIGSHISSNNNPPGGVGDSSSALASILGINLPTGSGSLQESSSSLWSAPSSSTASGPSPLAALNGSALPPSQNTGNMNPLHLSSVTMQANSGSSLIGGIPIGGMNGPGAIGGGGGVGGGSNKSDIALLQSLLPGVHITSDNSAVGLGGGNSGGNPGWTAAPPPSRPLGGVGLGGDPLRTAGSWDATGAQGGGNRMHPQPGSAVVGAIGRSGGQQKPSQPSGIW